jgi:hypothetical protein
MTLILSFMEEVQVRCTIVDFLGKEIRNGNIISGKSLRDISLSN